MPSFYPVILPAKRTSKGFDKVRIAVSHNGKTRYIVTDIEIKAGEFRSGRIVKRPDASAKNTKITSLLNKYESRASEIEYIDGLSCSELVSALMAGQRPCRLKEVFDEYISTARVKDTTIRLMRSCTSSLFTYLGEDYLLKRLNYAKIMGYEKELRKAGNCNGTIRTKMAIFSKIVKYAINSGYVRYEVNPFVHYHYPFGTIREAWLTVEELKRLRDTPLTGALRSLRDYIMLSYYLGGINAVDLMKLNFDTVMKTGRVRYKRTKTENMPKINEYVEFDAPDEIWPIVDRLIQMDGMLGTPYQRYNVLHDFTAQNIKRLREELDMPRLIYYSARKSFSQHAFELGVPTCVIDYIIGHKLGKGGSSLFNYITVTPKIASQAIRLVLDNIK